MPYIYVANKRIFIGNECKNIHMNMMDISLARTFLEVLASGSFGAAAERLHLTQTAVSARIKALEDQLGRRLFVRNKAGARLTEAIGMLDGALGQVRQWSFDLRPPLLDDLGLASALRWYLDGRIREFVIPHLKTPRQE